MSTGPALEGEHKARAVWAMIVLALTLVGIAFALERDLGFGLTDEGYLWYGTIETARGELPGRDFQAYEPGRYYWGALWLSLTGDDGILSLRASMALFEAVGIALGLLALRRVVSSWGLLVASGVLLCLWVHPRYRAYETTMTLAAVFFGTRLLERPSLRRYAEAAVFVGMAAVFGRNHALYCLVAFLLMGAVAWPRMAPAERSRVVIVALLGLVLGSFPLIALIAGARGFAHAFLEASLYNVLVANNVSISPPTPWTVAGALFGRAEITDAFRGWLCVLEPLALAMGAVLALRLPDSPRRALLLASVCVGAPYLHHLFSRPDAVHLTSSIHPLLVAAIAVAASSRASTAAALTALLAVSAASVGVAHPFFQRHWSSRHTYEQVRVGDDLVWMTETDALIVRTLKGIRREMRPEEQILVAPLWTAAYPILKRHSPLWRLSFALPESLPRQREMIRQLEERHVSWAVVCDIALDGREERRFSSAFEPLWGYLNAWPSLPAKLPAGCVVLHRGEAPGRSLSIEGSAAEPSAGSPVRIRE
jgi:hypothetical protein